MDRNYTVYKHTNKINGKVYIGQTNQEPSRRWKNGNGYKQQEYFWNAIAKYSWDGFEHEVLFSNLTHEEANFKEMELIAYYQSNNREYGYNISNGGNSIGKHTEETRSKISESNIGKRHTLESKEKMSKAKKGRESTFKGKRHTEEAKRQISEKNRGRKNPSLSARNKIFNAKATSVIQLDNSGNFIAEFTSLTRASQETGVNRCCIANVCKGKQEQAGGYKWIYLDEYEGRAA